MFSFKRDETTIKVKVFKRGIKTTAGYHDFDNVFIVYYDPKKCDMPASFALPELPLNQESEVNMLEKGQ